MAEDPFLVRDAHNPEVGLAALPEGENTLNLVVLSDIHTNMQDISRASAELGRRGVRCARDQSDVSQLLPFYRVGPGSDRGRGCGAA